MACKTDLGAAWAVPSAGTTTPIPRPHGPNEQVLPYWEEGAVIVLTPNIYHTGQLRVTRTKEESQSPKSEGHGCARLRSPTATPPCGTEIFLGMGS